MLLVDLTVFDGLRAEMCERSCADAIVGWLTSLAWMATLATGCIFVGTMLQGIIILNYPDYDAKPYHGAILAWAILVVAIIINTLIAGLLPFLEGLVLFLHILEFIAIMTALVYLSPHGKSSDVFFRTLNEGNGPTQGLSYRVGFIGNVATFVGKASHDSCHIYNSDLSRSRCCGPRQFS